MSSWELFLLVSGSPASIHLARVPLLAHVFRRVQVLLSSFSLSVTSQLPPSYVAVSFLFPHLLCFLSCSCPKSAAQQYSLFSCFPFCVRGSCLVHYLSFLLACLPSPIVIEDEKVLD